MRRVQVCRNCKIFIEEKICPKCKSTNLSTSWKGVVIINDPDSEIARSLKINEPGKYAIYVG